MAQIVPARAMRVSNAAAFAGAFGPAQTLAQASSRHSTVFTAPAGGVSARSARQQFLVKRDLAKAFKLAAHFGRLVGEGDAARLDLKDCQPVDQFAKQKAARKEGHGLTISVKSLPPMG